MKYLILAIIVLLAINGCTYFDPIEVIIKDKDTIKIASWNLQVFGDKKASDPSLMRFYVETIDDYDIIFLQEIRDKDGSAWKDLCMLLPDYECLATSRAGRSISKEQYVMLYKKGLNLEAHVDMNLRLNDTWERAPLLVQFDFNGTDLIIWNIHVKPSDVANELSELEKRTSTDPTDLEIISGDLNSHCDYYSPEKETQFDSWNWIIPLTEDTTVSENTRCVYDNFIINNLVYDRYVDSGVYKKGITPDVSDHYLIWLELEI